MSRLNELIQQYCPDGVEYKKLEECCQIWDNKRKPIAKGARVAGEYPYYGANGVQDYVADYIFDGKYVLVGEDGSVITPSGTPVVNWAEGKIWVNNHAHIISEKEGVPLRYLFHYLQTINITPLIHGNIPKLTGGDFRALTIPVPPLPVQEEIVRILDTLTELQAELQAELQKRRKQYEYYRDKLLTFSDLGKSGGWTVSVQWMKLGEIATLIRGGNFQKKDFTDSGVPCIHYGQIYTHFGIHTTSTLKYISPDVASKSKIAKTNDIVMAITSENVEDVGKCVAWMGDEDIAVSGHTAIIQHKQNAKYLSYYFHSSHFFTQKKRLAHGTKVIEISPKDLANVVIPIPPLAEQQRIVDILDRFHALTTDITAGLPAEIEARRKQYEYYRDQLLTFKQKA